MTSYQIVLIFTTHEIGITRIDGNDLEEAVHKAVDLAERTTSKEVTAAAYVYGNYTPKQLLNGPPVGAVLNWCLDGLWQMRETGLIAPESVKQATAQYRQDSDKIARFVSEMMEPDMTGEIRTEEAYQRYQEWCIRNGQHAEGMPTFKRSMEAHADLRKKRPNGSGREASKISLILGLKWQCGPEWSGIL